MDKLDFPQWFYEALPMLECPGPECGKPLEKRYILAEGIRKSMVHKKSTAFFIEYKCPYCHNVVTLELLKMTLRDFVMEMMTLFASKEDDSEDEVNDCSDKSKSCIKKNKAPKSSKISDTEISEISKVIKTCKSHYDFLKSIGLTDDNIAEIEKDGKKKDMILDRKKKNKNTRTGNN